jgi:TonB family protein
MSRPDSFDPPQPGGAPVSMDGSESIKLEDGLSLAELATALSTHGGGALSADLALDLVLNEIVEHARLATGATAAAIALARGHEIVCRATTGANAPDLGVRLDVHSGLSGACVQTKMWQRCDDTEIDSRVDAGVCRSLGVRSILVFPVVKEDALIGVFEIFSPRPNAFSDREIQTLQALSRNIVNNVDRAADVLAPPAPVLDSSSTTAATVASDAEVGSLSQAPFGHAQVDSVQPDAPIPAIDLLPETTTANNSKLRPRDRWMGVLTLLVIALALFLGWTMGYVGRQKKAPVGAKARAGTNATTLPVPAISPDRAALGTSAAPVLASNPPAVPLTAPASSQKSGTAVVPAGGLVVYEKGKVIYRTSSQSSRQSVKDASSQPITVPSKVADEYLLERIEPEYPEQAREQHIQGPVVLVALVGKDGAVEKLSTISGDSQLVAAATDAVLQWRFKPFFRNGSPEEFQTQITVSFRLP